MGMNIEDVLGNVKEALLKAAKEGKKRGITETTTKSIELIEKFKDEINNLIDKLVSDLNALCNSDENNNNNKK